MQISFARFVFVEYDSPMGVQCYWLEPIRKARLYLRRYSMSDSCTANGYYHNAETFLSEVDERYEFDDKAQTKLYTHDGPQNRTEVPADAVWPTHCACGYEFTESDQWQVFSDHLYKRTDTGAILTQREFGPGAMWDAEYLSDNPSMVGPDGKSIQVICPNGAPWAIDGPCNNCTEPDNPNHKCWLREGTPPVITVGKTGGDGVTCSAGAGSIQAGDYHGFLKAGFFEP